MIPESLLAEIGWKNAQRVTDGVLSLTVETLDCPPSESVGYLGGNRHHRALAALACAWLEAQGKRWKTEQWHAGYRCDILADGVVVEVGNTDSDRALEHLRCTDGLFCVVPYQDGEQTFMLIFRRGTNWDSDAVDALLVKKDKHSAGIAERFGLGTRR